VTDPGYALLVKKVNKGKQDFGGRGKINSTKLGEWDGKSIGEEVKLSRQTTTMGSQLKGCQ